MGNKVIWRRCPECGEWCKAEKKGFLGRAIRVFKKEEELISESVAEIGDLFGAKGTGRLIGKVLDKYSGIWKLPGEALAGDNYKFYCSCGERWGTDDENLDRTEEHNYCVKVNNLFHKYKSIGSLSETEVKDYVNSISTLLEIMKDNPYISDYCSSLYDLYASVQYFRLHDSNKALESINKSIEIWPYDPNAKALHGVFTANVQDAFGHYKKMQDLIQYKEADSESRFFSKSEFQTELRNESNKYADVFLQIPRENRKYIIVDDDLRYLPNSFLVLTSSMLPSLKESGLTFPNGYVSEKALYMCHPYKTNEYLDADNYKDELFSDQMNDLLEVLQCLGAKTIEIRDVKTQETTSMNSQDLNANIGGSKGKIKANVEGAYSEANESYEKTKNRFFHTHNFPLIENVAPHVWEDSTWYSHISQWQTMARMRLRGQEELKISIYSMRESLIKENEQIQLKADFDTMLAKGNVEGGRSLSFEKQEKVSHEWELEVKFYPLSSYKKKIFSALPSSSFSIDEKPTKKMNWKMWVMGGIILILLITILAILL